MRFMLKLSCLTITMLMAMKVCGGVALADAMDDYLKQLKKGAAHKDPKLCRFLTKDEVARYLGEPVRDGSPGGSGCIWFAVKGSDQVTVTRVEGRDTVTTPKNLSQYKTVSGVGERAFTAYNPMLGYWAQGYNGRGTTNVYVQGRDKSAAALALLKLAIQR
jgi:hypothetical protein